MYKESKAPNKLEVPDGWDIKRLGEITEIRTGDKDTQNKSLLGLYPFFVRSNTVEKIDSFSYDGEAILTSGDGVGVGKNYHYINGKFNFHQRVYCIRKFDSKVNGKFVYYYFSEYFYERVKKYNAKNSVDSVRMEMIFDMKIPLPPLPEQKAIATVLSTWDEAIQKTEALIQQKELRKKWLMQQLLTGKKRLKGFENKTVYHKTELGLKIPLDWVIVRVKDIFSERKQTSKDQLAYPLFSLTIENGLTEKTERYERSFLLKNKEENLYKLIYPNDILFNPMNLRFGAIAKSKIDKIVSVSAYYNSLYPKIENAYVDYYEALFKTPIFMNLYDRIAIGSLIEKKRVHLSNFNELEIPFPSYQEQQAIAKVLQTADKEINLLKTKADKLREQKKGLMQVLLTGKKRLNLNLHN